MSNLFKTGVQWGASQLLANAADSITIRRGTSTWTTPAVVAKSEFEDADGNGRRVNLRLVDFIISAAVGYVPQKGDLIEYQSSIYIVRPYGKEIWRYGDPFSTLLRIHTQYDRAVE